MPIGEINYPGNHQGQGAFLEENTGIEEPSPQRLKRAPFEDLDEVRQLLELKIAQKTALHRSDARLVRCEQCLKRRKDAAAGAPVTECIQTDIDFT